VERWVDLGEMVDAEFRAHDFTARWKDWDRWQLPPGAPRLLSAKDFLYRQLADGEQRSVEIETLAHQSKITARTLDRARRDLGVRSVRRGAEWWLSLPDGT
jgi:hypothetical protein